MAPSASPGDEFLGCDFEDFEQLDRLGAGGNADVYRATVTVDGDQREVALKTPRLTDFQTVEAEFYEDFVEETNIWTDLDDHENVVSVLDWGSEPYPWIALEYMEWGNLGDVDLSLSLETRVALFEDVCNAVFHAHRHGVTHGDLKPENVLLTRDADGELTAKIGDWGLATVLLEHSGSVDGLTMSYSAPEQLDSSEYGQPDDRTDIYQVGAIAYELFTGEQAIDGSGTGEMVHRILNRAPDPPSSRNHELPDGFDQPIQQALAKQKDDRQETVLYLRDAVQDEVVDSGVTGSGATRTETGDGDHVDLSDGDGSSDGARSTDALDEHIFSEDVDVEEVSEAARSGARENYRHLREKIADRHRTGAETDHRRGEPVDSSRVRETSDDTGGTDTGSDGTGILGRMASWWHKPVDTLDTDSAGFGHDLKIALQYPRRTDPETFFNYWKITLASVLLVPIPLWMGSALDFIRQSAAGRAPTIRLGDGQWMRLYKQGVVGLALVGGWILVAGLLFEAAGVDTSATRSSTSPVASIAGIVALLWWFAIPGLLMRYGTTRSLRKTISLRAFRVDFSTHYLGTVIGLAFVGTVSYFVASFLFVTMVGIVFAGIYPAVAVAAFLGRRASDWGGG